MSSFLILSFGDNIWITPTQMDLHKQWILLLINLSKWNISHAIFFLHSKPKYCKNWLYVCIDLLSKSEARKTKLEFLQNINQLCLEYMADSHGQELIPDFPRSILFLVLDSFFRSFIYILWCRVWKSGTWQFTRTCVLP